jgi:hypothetical protein
MQDGSEKTSTRSQPTILNLQNGRSVKVELGPEASRRLSWRLALRRSRSHAGDQHLRQARRQAPHQAPRETTSTSPSTTWAEPRLPIRAVLWLWAAICLGGDIHEELMKTNDRTTQQAIEDLIDLIAGGLDLMATTFGKLFVPCVVGNHGRSTKKMQMKERVFTSHEWNVYCGVARHFRRSKHVQFCIPKLLIARLTSLGIAICLLTATAWALRVVMASSVRSAPSCEARSRPIDLKLRSGATSIRCLLATGTSTSRYPGSSSTTVSKATTSMPISSSAPRIHVHHRHSGSPTPSTASPRTGRSTSKNNSAADGREAVGVVAGLR